MGCKGEERDKGAVNGSENEVMGGVGLGRGKECRNEKMEASWKRGGIQE